MFRDSPGVDCDPLDSTEVLETCWQHFGGSTVAISAVRKSVQATTELTTEYTPHPAPEVLDNAGSLTFVGGIVYSSALFFEAPSGGDLVWGPLGAPFDLAAGDHIVGLARLLPVTNRRPKRRSTIRLVNRPFSWTERCPDLCTASTCAKVRRCTESL